MDSLETIFFNLFNLSNGFKFIFSRPDVFYNKVVLRNFPKFIGKHLDQSLYFNKVAVLRLAT